MLVYAIILLFVFFHLLGLFFAMRSPYRCCISCRSLWVFLGFAFSAQTASTEATEDSKDADEE